MTLACPRAHVSQDRNSSNDESYAVRSRHGKLLTDKASTRQCQPRPSTTAARPRPSGKALEDMDDLPVTTFQLPGRMTVFGRRTIALGVTG